MSHPLRDSTVLTVFQAAAAKIDGRWVWTLSAGKMKPILLWLRLVSFLWQNRGLSFLPFLGNVRNHAASWVCRQVWVQGDSAGVCLLCLMTRETCNCWTSPRLQWAPSTGAAWSHFTRCCRRQELFSQMWALTFWRHSDSHRSSNNVSAEKQSKGNRAPLILPVFLSSSLFAIFLPGASLSLYIHSSAWY